jgi:acetylornithine deacetylase/succinyl-diaminopimelate desuccinylase-like protein
MSVPPAITALSARAAELSALLERWANINSGSSHGAGLTRMAAELRAVFSAAFPAATCEELSADAPGLNPPGVKALRFRMRPQAALRVFLCGHYDTVYAADDAFQSCRWLADGTLNGPGVTDMKGGLIVMLAALEAFEQTPHAASLGWEVLLTPDEETGSHGTRAMFEEAAPRHHFGFVFEPARPSGDIIHSRKGTGGITATCHGRAAHAAKIPNDGRNAILGLAAYLLAIARIPAESARGDGQRRQHPRRHRRHQRRAGLRAVGDRPAGHASGRPRAAHRPIGGGGQGNSRRPRREDRDHRRVEPAPEGESSRPRPRCSRSSSAPDRMPASNPSTGFTAAVPRTATFSARPGCPASTASAPRATTCTAPVNTVAWRRSCRARRTSRCFSSDCRR